MKWYLDKDRPICPQMEEHICVAVATGALPPGSRLPSVRDMAVEASVNPNTVQKAMEGLEQKSVLYSMRGSGWYVSDTIEPAIRLAQELMAAKTKAYITAMKRLGCRPEHIEAFIKEWNT